MLASNAGKKGRKRMKEVEDDDYRKKRDKNNLAVKKSRVKSRQKTQDTMMRVQQLKSENDQLEEKINLLSKELNFLKDLFMAHAAGSASSVNLKDIDLEKFLADDEGEDSKLVSL